MKGNNQLQDQGTTLKRFPTLQREVITLKFKCLKLLIKKKSETVIKCKLLNFKMLFKDESLCNKSIL